MTVSIIILNYNDYKLTAQYVESILDYSIIDRIIVVDNCSTDDSYLHLCKLRSDKVDVITSEKNNGYAYGNNTGVKYLCDKYGAEGIVIFSNPDITVSEESIIKIVSSFNRFDDQFAATGEINSLSGERINLFTWKLPTKAVLFVENSIVLRNILRVLFHFSRRYSDLDKINHDNYYSGEAIPGCFFAVDLKRFLEVGMFCEKTFLYYEEEILFYNAAKYNYSVHVIKDAPIIHAEGATTKKNIKSWRKCERILEDSCVIYMQECLNAKGFICFLYRFLNRLYLPERYLFYKLKALMVKNRSNK